MMLSGLTTGMGPSARSALLDRHGVRLGEVIYWAGAVSVFFLFPDYLAFATSVLVWALFVMSLALILGFAGIISMGHALFFGIGAYATGLCALQGWTEL